MQGMFDWVGELVQWIAAWVPTWIQVDCNEQAIKHKGWRKRRAVLIGPGVRWYWPAFSQIEGPFRMVWQPLNTSAINIMDKEESPVAACGFVMWRITDLTEFAVNNKDTPFMLDDLVCAAIREVITTKSVAEIQGNSRKTIDNALLREVKDLTEGLGVEVQIVRLTTFTKARMLCVMGDEAAVVDAGDDPKAPDPDF